MRLKNSIFSTIILALPMLSSLSYSQSSSSSDDLNLDSLRSRCVELRQNQQVKPFQIRVECSGRYTYWDKEASMVALENSSKIIVAENGKISESYDEKKLKEYMKWDSIEIEVNLKLGNDAFKCFTCDFTHDYIDINADYRN